MFFCFHSNLSLYHTLCHKQKITIILNVLQLSSQAGASSVFWLIYIAPVSCAKAVISADGCRRIWI